MEPTEEKKYEEARRRLLEEGTRSYLDAVNALVAYRNDVQTICRTVLERYIVDYAAALKVRLGGHDIQDAESPSLKDWEGDYWSLGVKIIRKDITDTIRWWEAYCYLSYEPDDTGLHCWIGEWFPNKQLAATLFGKFSAMNKLVKNHGNVLSLEKVLNFDSVCHLEKDLDSIVKEWVKLWKSVGGIKQAFKR